MAQWVSFNQHQLNCRKINKQFESRIVNIDTMPLLYQKCTGSFTSDQKKWHDLHWICNLIIFIIRLQMESKRSGKYGLLTLIPHNELTSIRTIFRSIWNKSKQRGSYSLPIILAGSTLHYKDRRSIKLTSDGGRLTW